MEVDLNITPRGIQINGIGERKGEEKEREEEEATKGGKG